MLQTVQVGAVRIEKALDRHRIHIPHNTVHRTVRDGEMAAGRSKKSHRRKRVRYERTCSNSMWHTDYKRRDDGRWFIAYQDDASRFIAGYDMLE